jgi:hypothetical protein
MRWLVFVVTLTAMISVLSGTVFAAGTCGQSCLGSIGRLYGIEKEALDKAEEALPKKRSHSMLELQEAFGVMGVQMEGRELSIEDLRALGRPVVSHLDDNHFAVIESVGESDVLWWDDGIRQGMTISDLQKRWKGNTLVPRKKPASFTDKSPAAVFVPVTEDEKTFEPGEIGYVDCVVQNRGNAPLVVRGKRASCTCLEIAKGSLSIEPGKAASVRVKVDAGKALLGRGRYFIYVATNDPLQDIVQVPVRVKVQESLICRPLQAEIGASRQGAADVARFRLIWTKGTECEVTSVRSLDPRLLLSVKVPEHQPSEMCERNLVVSIAPDATPGPVATNLILFTDRLERSFSTVRITGEIVGDIATELDQIFLRVLSKKDIKEFSVWSRSGNELLNPTAICGSRLLAATINAASEKSGRWIVTLRPTSDDFNGIVEDTLLIETGDKSEAVVLPVYVEFARDAKKPSTSDLSVDATQLHDRMSDANADDGASLFSAMRAERR